MFARPQLAPVKQRKDALKDATVREFDGGWNVVDNELNLSTRYSIILDNMSREEDGSIGVRWGTELFADIALVATSGMTDVNAVHIINHTYFQDSTVTVLSNGRIVRTLGDGTTTTVWSATIAGGLVGTPPGWGATDFASFAVFSGKLIVCNGTDKPLIIDFDNAPPVQYLADEATGSNANTPICRYVIAMNTFLCMAGDPLFPDRVHISNQYTSGTWFGDPVPNDATYADLGKVGVQGDQVITGLNRYREQLVVGFSSASVLGTLGAFETIASVVTHVPRFEDVIEGYGCHSHRTMFNLGNDLFMLDHQGVTSIARSLYSGSVEPKRVSELIDPAISANVTRLNENGTLLGAHAVYNAVDKQYMCFVPNHSEIARSLATNPFEVLQDDNTALWVRIPNHPFSVGDVVRFTGVTAWNTVLAPALNNVDIVIDRVINADIVQIAPETMVPTDPNGVLIGGGAAVQYIPQWTETIGYIYTFITELKVRAWARFRGWRWRSSARTELGNVIFADDKRLFTLGNQNNPIYTDFVGTDEVRPIAFVWELPWADFDKRLNVKHTRYLQLDTRGAAMFMMMMFVDQFYTLNGVLIPNNVLTFTAGNSGGYGNGPQPFGGGRRTSDQRLFAWVAHGKIFKLRFQGATDQPLRIVAVSLLYNDGSIRR